MAFEWDSIITDPDELKVFRALSNPEWDFRTVEGISSEIGVAQERVVEVLEKYPSFVRVSPLPDERGRRLYTLRSKPVGTQEQIALTQRVMKKSIF